MVGDKNEIKYQIWYYFNIKFDVSVRIALKNLKKQR